MKKRHPLEKIVIVDDTPKKLLRNYGNHVVVVREWTGDPADRKLGALLIYLEELDPSGPPKSEAGAIAERDREKET